MASNKCSATLYQYHLVTMYCKIGNFREILFSRSFMKIKPSRNRSVVFLMAVNHDLVANFERRLSFNAIRENKIIVEISEFTVIWAMLEISVLIASVSSEC